MVNECFLIPVGPCEATDSGVVSHWHWELSAGLQIPSIGIKASSLGLAEVEALLGLWEIVEDFGCAHQSIDVGSVED
jgi:hypothetical protein